MKLVRALAPLLFAVTAAGTSNVHAVTYSLASGYNVYVLDDAKLSNAQVEGGVAIGGDAQLSNYGIGTKASGGDILVVAGELKYSNGQVHNGNVVYGTSVSGAASVPKGSISKGDAVDFAGINNDLTTASSYWGSLSANGSMAFQWGGLTLTGTSSGVNVFTLEAAVLASTNNFVIDAPSGSTVLVNITGDAATMKGMGIQFRDANGDGSGSVSTRNVLYNFVDATSLHIHSIGVKGSVLAPKATVTFNNGDIEGQLIAGSLHGSGGFHDIRFEGGGLPSSLPVPEPSSLLLCAAGGLLALRRRRPVRA